MFLSRLTRIRVVVISATMLLGCQSLAVAQGRASSAGATHEAPAAHSCHDPGGSGSNGDNEADCPSKNAFSAPSGTELPAVTALPAITFKAGILDRVIDAAEPAESPLVHIEPPPLSILHCCLRN